MTQPNKGTTVSVPISNEQITEALIPTLREFVSKEALDIKEKINAEIRSYGNELLGIRTKTQEAQTEVMKASLSVRESVQELKIKADNEIKVAIDKHRNYSIGVIAAIVGAAIIGTSLLFGNQLLSLSDQISKSRESVAKINLDIDRQTAEAKIISEKITAINALLGANSVAEGIVSISTNIASIRENLTQIVTDLNKLKTDLKAISFTSGSKTARLELK